MRADPASSSSDVAIAAAIAETLRRELDEDYVGIWKIPWHIRHRVEGVSDERVLGLGKAVLETLLDDSTVRIGSLSGESDVFTPWPREHSVEHVMLEWSALGRDPNIAEIAWLARDD
jgi:hypothetical protein